MKLIKRTLVHLTVILVLISLTSQFRIKRQEGPSETDNAEPLDESLRTDHLPLHDETELAVVENDVSLTPDDQIVESTPPNNEFLSKPDDESESGSESSSLESSTIEENMTNSNSQSTESEMISESQSEETNTYLQDEALETQQVDTTEVNSLSETDFPETTVPTSSRETQESEVTNASETSETNEVFEDTVQTAKTTVESENIELIEETTQLAETTVEPKNTEEIDSHEVDETTESYTENEELKKTTVTPKDETTQVVSETHATTSENTFEKAVEAKTTEDSTENETTQAFEEVTEKKNEEQFIENPSDDQLLESNKIANDYEDEITTTKSPTTKPNVWFKPTKSMRINDSYDDESHITANCPSLNCEFGYKTDLYGKPICACFNPCHEKKCGDHVCKIEKLSETKFIGACYDPRKIERPLYCHLPLATGTCKNYTSRFYFNSFMQKCSHFVYTGCGGNQNNFDTWEKCEMECNTCSLPAVRGPCKGNIIRYHYDLMKRECVAFNWGGCKGNENNFQTRKHCEDSCIFRKEGALFLHGMPVRMIRKYHQKEKN